MDSDQSDDEVQLESESTEVGEQASNPTPTGIVDNQTIEISSDSCNEDSQSHTDSDEVGIIDDDSDEDNDSPEEQGLEETFDSLLNNPDKEYRHLVQLSDLAFKLNDLEKIEQMIAEFDKLAIMPAHIWLKYLKARLVVTQTEEERKKFEEDCAKSLSSFYNTSLAEFIVEQLVEQKNIKNTLLWANLLADYGLERPDFIEKLRSLMSAANLTEEESSALNELMEKYCPTWSSPAEQVKTINDLIKTFHKHLDTFKPQYNDCNWAKVHSSFMEKADELPLNDQIQDGFCKLIFERCVAKFPPVDALWMDYIRFVEDENTDDDDIISNQMATKKATRLPWGYLKANPLDLARRAVKCRPTIRINHKYLHLMERANYTQAQVDDELKLLLVRIQPEMTMSVELHLDYLAYLLRVKNVGEEEQANEVRAAFQNSWDILSDLYGDQADTSYEVLQLWAQVEYCQMSSPARAAQIWRQIMGYPGSAYRGQLWMNYAQMDCEFNGGQSARTILREAMAQPSMEDSHLVQELYRRYERVYGTYETIADCQSQNPPSPEWRQARRRPLLFPQHPPQRQHQRQPRNNQNRKQKKMPALLPAPKPTPPPPPPPAQSQPKTFGSNFKYSTHLETNKIFIKNLPADCSKEQLTEIFEPFGTIKDIRLVYKFNKQFKGIAYIEFELPAEAQKAVASCDGVEIGGQKIFVAISNPPPKSLNTTVNPPILQSAPKRRMPTSLIPTTLVRQETKRRKQLDVEQNNSVVAETLPANGSDQSSNGNESENKATETTTTTTPTTTTTTDATADPVVPKSNNDFRKMFNI